MELTERQLQILKSAIEKYISAGEPVGSQHLVEEQNFRFSPATARNEFALLAREGFLSQPHISAGRVPTTLGLRFYLTHLLEEEALPVLQEVALKQRIYQARHDFYNMLRSAVVSLAEASNLLAIATTDEGFVAIAGGAKLLEHPEFWNMTVAKAVLDLIDRHEVLHEVFSKAQGKDEVHVLIGGELGISDLEPVGLVFSHYDAPRRKGYVAVFGPNRLPYAKIIPQVRYAAQLLSELGKTNGGSFANGNGGNHA